MTGLCVLRCLCSQGHVIGGRACPAHPWRWINPTPDPARTAEALQARAGFSSEVHVVQGTWQDRSRFLRLLIEDAKANGRHAAEGPRRW